MCPPAYRYFAGRIIARGTQQELTRDLPGELRLRFDSPPTLPDHYRRTAVANGIVRDLGEAEAEAQVRCF